LRIAGLEDKNMVEVWIITTGVVPLQKVEARYITSMLDAH
jgi:hypothetical protein